MPMPLLVPLPEAARRTGLPEDTLRQWAESGKVMAGISPEGGILVAVQDGQVVMLENGQRQNGLENQATGNGEHEHEGDVFELNRRLAQIERVAFKDLEGVGISISEAARKYSLLPQTVHVWAKRGLVRVLDEGKGRGSRKIVNEADVAYLASIHHLRKRFGVRSGIPLLDEEGRPKLLKHPSLSKLRHQ